MKILQEEIVTTVQKGIDAMYNKRKPELIKKYYHPGYVLQIVKENDLQLVYLHNRLEARADWERSGQCPIQAKVEIKIQNIESSGNAATVYFNYFMGNVHTCDDFIALYKFADGWKIVNQTTYHIADF